MLCCQQRLDGPRTAPWVSVQPRLGLDGDKKGLAGPGFFDVSSRPQAWRLESRSHAATTRGLIYSLELTMQIQGSSLHFFISFFALIRGSHQRLSRELIASTAPFQSERRKASTSELSGLHRRSSKGPGLRTRTVPVEAARDTPSSRSRGASPEAREDVPSDSAAPRHVGASPHGAAPRRRLLARPRRRAHRRDAPHLDRILARHARRRRLARRVAVALPAAPAGRAPGAPPGTSSRACTARA